MIDSRTIRAALGLPSAGDAPARAYAGVSTDTRTLRPGELFIALSGERADGADHLPEAARRGARGAIVPAGREDPSLPLEYFGVDDPLEALGALASAVRRAAAARVVGITGSSGKTTVKEMAALALAGAALVHRTEGNLNSLVGLPLTILRAPADAKIWVLELGANEPGEIARLTAIAAPDDAVVTTVGPAHLERFGSVETVLNEKLDLVRGASQGGAIVVGERPPFLVEAARAIRPDTVVAGLEEGADFRPGRHGVGPDRVWFERAGTRCEVPVGGEHHLRDALIAAALAERLGVDPGATAAGLARYRPLGLRGAVRRAGGLTIVADCYNANPESFAAAIEYCRELFPGRRLAAFVGTMLELGAVEDEAHRDVTRLLVDAGFSWIAATGAFEPAARAVDRPESTRFVVVADPRDAWAEFAEGLHGDEVVLVKASRGARLEWIVERLERRFGPADPGGEETDPAGAASAVEGGG